MTAENYDSTYEKEFKQLLTINELSEDFLKDIPHKGIIILNKNPKPGLEQVVAAGFIREVEGGYGLLDGYITNKNYPSSGRNIALDMLTRELMRLARLSKIKQIFAFTNQSTIVERALSFGFEQQFFQKVLVKNLDGGKSLWAS